MKIRSTPHSTVAAIIGIFAAITAMTLAWPVSGQEIDPPAKPTGLTNTATHNSVTLTWDAPNDNSITHYMILRRNPITHDPGQFDVLEANTGNADTTYADNTVEPETRYSYRIKAVNPHGESNRSYFTRADTPAAPVPPSAPTGLTTSGVTHESVTLTWDDPDDDSITGYRILRRERDAGTELQAIIEDTGLAANTYTDDTVKPETAYEYRVKAINNDGVSEQSNPAPADTPTEPTPPAAPANLAANPSHNRVTLIWDDPEDDTITGYRVLRGPDDNTLETIVENTDSAETQYVDESVELETTYAYGVRAINGVGAGEQSDVVEATTLAAHRSR